VELPGLEDEPVEEQTGLDDLQVVEVEVDFGHPQPVEEEVAHVVQKASEEEPLVPLYFLAEVAR
jgi:hypothetical protein